MTISFICFILAAVCFLLSTVGVVTTRVNLQSLGLLFLSFAFILGGFRISP